MKPLDNAIADAQKPLLELVGDTSQWSDEQWQQHDERVRADVARRESVIREAVRRERRQRFEDAGFPARALDAAFAADEAAPAIARIDRWNPADRCVLVIGGVPGSGKTVAATWWALRQSFVPVFVRASTLAANSRYDASARDRFLAAPSALVLDDLGAEYFDEKGSFLVDLDELVDTYYSNRKPLLITTNLEHTKFRERYGVRIVDRLRECGMFWQCPPRSLRGARTP